MRSASNCQKLHRYLLPVALSCLLVALVSFSGCITGLPGLSRINFLPGSGSPADTTSPPVYDTSQAQATQVQTTGTTAGSCRQGLTSCSGNCVDITLDIGNCGGCGMVCPTDARCNEGACYCKDGYEAAADGTCTHVSTPAAETGNTGQDQQNSCADYPGTTYCNDGYCWYLTEDNHCGACDNACPIDQACMNGQCVPSQTDVNAPTTTICNSESDCTLTSEQKLLLQQEHEKIICVQGNCVPACISGYSNCDGNLQNGCEASLLTDTSNCGSCGTTCPTGGSCSSGACHCPTGYLIHNGACIKIAGVIDPSQVRRVACLSPNDVCNGDCVNTQTDAANCGACGTTCATNGGYCSVGVCHCPTGYLTHNGACTKIASIGDRVVVQPIVRKYVSI